MGATKEVSRFGIFRPQRNTWPSRLSILRLRHLGVQVGEQCGHLLLSKSAGEAGHQALAVNDLVADYGVGGGDTAGQLRALQDGVNLGRRGLESQIVVFMTMGAADGVKMLALGLLRGQGGLGVAAGQREQRWDDDCAAASPRSQSRDLGHMDWSVSSLLDGQ